MWWTICISRRSDTGNACDMRSPYPKDMRRPWCRSSSSSRWWRTRSITGWRGSGAAGRSMSAPGQRGRPYIWPWGMMARAYRPDGWRISAAGWPGEPERAGRVRSFLYGREAPADLRSPLWDQDPQPGRRAYGGHRLPAVPEGRGKCIRYWSRMMRISSAEVWPAWWQRGRSLRWQRWRRMGRSRWKRR